MTDESSLEFVGKINSKKLTSLEEDFKKVQYKLLRIILGCFTKLFIHFDAERVTINKPKTIIAMPIKSVSLNSLPRTR
jgi:hypothetical protein